jgi:hypothetical protein
MYPSVTEDCIIALKVKTVLHESLKESYESAGFNFKGKTTYMYWKVFKYR